MEFSSFVLVYGKTCGSDSRSVPGKRRTLPPPSEVRHPPSPPAAAALCDFCHGFSIFMLSYICSPLKKQILISVTNVMVTWSCCVPPVSEWWSPLSRQMRTFRRPCPVSGRRLQPSPTVSGHHWSFKRPCSTGWVGHQCDPPDSLIQTDWMCCEISNNEFLVIVCLFFLMYLVVLHVVCNEWESQPSAGLSELVFVLWIKVAPEHYEKNILISTDQMTCGPVVLLNVFNVSEVYLYLKCTQQLCFYIYHWLL